MLATALAFGLRNWKPLVIGFALLAVFAWHRLEVSRSYRAGQAAEREAARIEAGKRIQEMEKTNEAFRNATALERCRIFMRDSGLSIDNCK